MGLELIFLNSFSYAGNGGSRFVKNDESGEPLKDLSLFPISGWRHLVTENVNRISPFKLNERLEYLFLKYQHRLDWHHVEILLDSLISAPQIPVDSLYSKENVEHRVISLYRSIYPRVSLNPNLADLESMKARSRKASHRINQTLRFAPLNRYYENKNEFETAVVKLEELEETRKSCFLSLGDSYEKLERMKELAQVVYQEILNGSHVQFPSSQMGQGPTIQKVIKLDQILVRAMNELRKFQSMTFQIEKNVSDSKKFEGQMDSSLTYAKTLAQTSQGFFSEMQGSGECTWINQERGSPGFTEDFMVVFENWRQQYLSSAYEIVEKIQSISQHAHREWKEK
jgi:hypothetical protein